MDVRPDPDDPITMSDKADPAFRDAVHKALLQLAPADVAKVGAFLDRHAARAADHGHQDTYQPLFDLASALHLTEKDV